MRFFCFFVIGYVFCFGSFVKNVCICLGKFEGWIFFVSRVYKMLVYGFRIIFDIWVKLVVFLLDVYFDWVIIWKYKIWSIFCKWKKKEKSKWNNLEVILKFVKILESVCI